MQKEIICVEMWEHKIKYDIKCNTWYKLLFFKLVLKKNCIIKIDMLQPKYGTDYF